MAEKSTENEIGIIISRNPKTSNASPSFSLLHNCWLSCWLFLISKLNNYHDESEYMFNNFIANESILYQQVTFILEYWVLPSFKCKHDIFYLSYWTLRNHPQYSCSKMHMLFNKHMSKCSSLNSNIYLKIPEQVRKGRHAVLQCFN